MRSRISSASVIAVAVLAVAALFHGPPGADATQGQAVLAGFGNSESFETKIWNTNTFTSDSCGGSSENFDGGLHACGMTGVSGNGAISGILGSGQTGVNAKGTSYGVWATGNTAVVAYGTMDGVFGSSEGIGVQGSGDVTGIGVQAKSSSGTALQVLGQAEFSRSGTVTIAYPNKTATVTGVPVTAKSMAFATLQQFLAGRYVVAVVPNLSGSFNSFTIYLNKAPGSSSTPKSVVVA